MANGGGGAVYGPRPASTSSPAPGKVIARAAPPTHRRWMNALALAVAAASLLVAVHFWHAARAAKKSLHAATAAGTASRKSAAAGPTGVRGDAAVARQMEEGLTFVSLMYHAPSLNSTWDSRILTHNCLLIKRSAAQSRQRHRFLVFTDEPAASFCRHCECRVFKRFNCPCAGGGTACDARNPCEKLFFLTDLTKRLPEFVLLDSDLIIASSDFAPRLLARSRAHDFLASYGHMQADSSKFHRDINSGLFFLRVLPGVNYQLMRKRFFDVGASCDQATVTWFVHNFYDNWDTLSFRWHCRGFTLGHTDVPLGQCYTVHGRLEVHHFVHRYGFRMLTTEDVRRDVTPGGAAVAAAPAAEGHGDEKWPAAAGVAVREQPTAPAQWQTASER